MCMYVYIYTHVCISESILFHRLGSPKMTNQWITVFVFLNHLFSSARLLSAE